MLGYRFDDDEELSFAMPIATGNLRPRLGQTASDHELAFSYFEQILAAIEHAHQNGIVHRDLKPENVLFLAGLFDDYPVISDFGLGRLLDRDTTTLTQAGGLFVTFGYAAPEQYSDAPNADARSDIYSLGVLLREMLTNAHPLATVCPAVTQGT